MTLGGVNPGDIVLADRMGRRFYAIVIARRECELEVEPLDRRVTYHRVKSREVLGIWHRRRTRAATVGSRGVSLNGASSRSEAAGSVAA